MLSSAAIDQRMKVSDFQMTKLSPEKSLGGYNMDNYRTEPENFHGRNSVKKVIFEEKFIGIIQQHNATPKIRKQEHSS